MPTYNTNNMLAELARETKEMLAFAEELKDLSPAQWTWKPTPKKWSIAECIGHLNIFAKHYLERAEKAMNAKGTMPNAATQFKSGYWGEKLTASMKPLPDGQIPSPMGTMGMFDPTKKERVNKDTLDTFIKYHKLMLAQIEKAGQYNIEGIRITSTLGPIIRFKLGDTFRFMVAHDQRHLLQARRLITTVGFPEH